MRRTQHRVIALTVLALALAFGCMRAIHPGAETAAPPNAALATKALAPSPSQTRATLAPPATAANAPLQPVPVALKPTPFDSLIDPPSFKLFTTAKPLEKGTKAISTAPPARIMVAGDSFAVGIGLSLAQSLKGAGVTLDQRGKTSSGLNSPRFFDWNASLAKYLDAAKPDALVVMLGANDAHNGAGTTAWAEDFSRKTAHFIDIAAKKGVFTYWVALPPMKDPAFNAKAETANDAMRNACKANSSCAFIESLDILGDEAGRYVSKKALDGKIKSLRAKDGVHLTMNGYKALSDKILDKCAGKREISLKE